MKKIKEYNNGTMTKAALMTMIRWHLRKLSLRWKPRNEALNAARRPYKGKDKRIKWEYKCNKCKKWFLRKFVEVDHIIECGSIKDWGDIGEFCKRMLVEKGFQILCKPCHLQKTNSNTIITITHNSEEKSELKLVPCIGASDKFIGSNGAVVIIDKE